MESFWQDVRYALRMLRKNPGITLVVMLTLGLGIGVNTAIFSIINSFLLRPLPVKDARHLMVLANSHPGSESPHGLSYLDSLDFRKGADSFADICGFTVGFAGLSEHGHAERVTVSYVTGNYFEMLGVRSALGRLFLSTEGQTADADPVIVLGHGYWENRLGGSPAVIGQIVKLNGHPFTVIGVVPAEFRGTYSMLEMDAYVPINMISVESGTSDALTKRNNHRLNVLARLRPGISIQQATAQLQVTAGQLGKQYPDTDNNLKMYVFPELIARPQPANALSNPPVAGIFLVLVTLVLLIACVNVANIVLVRFTSRERELAMRTALGASRRRLVRQLLTEGALLALLGGGTGLLIGELGSWILGSVRLPVDLPIYFDFSLDWRVFTYVAAIVLMSALLVGLIPAWRSCRPSAGDTLRAGPGAGSGTKVRQRLRTVLVVAQVVGSVILMTTAGLFVRSLGALQNVNIGFRPDHLLNLVMDPEQIGYDETRAKGFYRELEERARSLPGIESASLAFSIPMSDYNAFASVTYQGQVLAPGEKGLNAGYNMIGTEYFRTMGIQLLRGRMFADTDSLASQPVAIVNEVFAQRLWPGQTPLGKRFSASGPGGPFVEVVGVAETGRYGTLTELPQPFFYVPISQKYSSLRVLEVRTAVPPGHLAKPLEELIHRMEPDLPVFDVRTMEESLQGENGFFPFHIGAAVTGVLGSLGLILGVVGMYGVVSFATSQRTHEIGIRVALGAQSRDILKLVLSHALMVVLCGIGIGLVATVAVSRLLANLLFGVKPNDPVIYGLVVIILSTVAMTACYIPAHRATKIDPLDALRYE